MTWALFEIDEVISHAYPIITRDTSMVHVLTNVPLTAAAGKKVVAKELMLWEGSDCYFCVGPTGGAAQAGGGEDGSKAPAVATGATTAAAAASVATTATTTVTGSNERKRYVAYNGPIWDVDLNIAGADKHSLHGLAAALLHLIAIALATVSESVT